MSEVYSDEILHAYKSLFIPNFSRAHKRLGTNWYPEKDPSISFNKIRQHLSESVTLGRTLPSGLSKFFVLDFDYKEQEYPTYKSFLSFVSYCISLVQAPKIILQSSESLGVHVYFFLTWTQVELLKERVSDFFKSKGIVERAGKFEIYTSLKNLRLPLGPGSHLLDSTLNRLHQNKEQDLKYVYSFYKNLRAPKLYDAIPRYNKPTEYRKTSYAKSEDVLKYGITNYKTTNATIIKLAFHYINECGILNHTELFNKIRNWFDLNNNGKSTTYNTDLEALDREIELAVSWSLRRNEKGQKAEQTFLTKDISLFLLEFYPKEYSRQEPLFKLFQYIKTKSLEGKLLIPISQSFILKHCGFSRHNYKYVLENLQELGYIKLERFGSPLKGHCNYYSYHGPDLLAAGEGTGSLAEFIVKEGLLCLYSRHTQSKILEVSNAIQSS